MSFPGSLRRMATSLLGWEGDSFRAAGGASAAGAGSIPADEWRLGRPSIPPLMIVALFLWLAVAVGLDTLFGQTQDACLLAAFAGVLLALLAAVAFRGARPLLACAALGAGLGLLLAAASAFSLLSQAGQLVGTAGWCEAVAAHDSQVGDYGASVVARLGSGALVRVNLPDDGMVLAGDGLGFQADWRAPGARAARSSWRNGVVAVSSAQNCKMHAPVGPLAGLRQVRRTAIGVLQERERHLGQATGWDFAESGLFLQAVILGYAAELYPSGLYQTVKVDGLAHLVAVSGAHLVIVCGIVVAVMKRLALARVVALALQLALVACYLAITGAPVSAVRAAVMTLLALTSFFSGRRPYALGALSACIVAMVALRPATAFSLSFLLSAAATLGIVLFSGFFAGWLQELFALPSGALLDSLALTLAASFATGPLAACVFGQVSLLSPVANLLAAPVFTVVCGGGLAALLLQGLCPPLGAMALAGVFLLAQLLCSALGLLAQVPCASVPLAFDAAPAAVAALGVPLAVWVAWPPPTRRALGFLLGAFAAGVTLFLLAPLLRGDAVTMLDIGQGDAILLQSGGRSLLIDTGTQDTLLLEGLGACAAAHLDAVLITHPDDDHCGSLSALRGVVGVDQVLVARDLLAEDDVRCAKLRRQAAALVGAAGITGLSAGDVIQLGNLRLTVVGPRSFSDAGGNADSLVLRMEADVNGDGACNCTALFCGDAEAPQLQAYCNAGLVGTVDLYKVGHHGSRAAVDARLARELQPSVSLVSVGEGNRYGHPVASTLECLEGVGSTVYRTDLSGMITCRLREDGILVQTER